MKDIGRIVRQRNRYKRLLQRCEQVLDSIIREDKNGNLVIPCRLLIADIEYEIHPDISRRQAGQDHSQMVSDAREVAATLGRAEQATCSHAFWQGRCRRCGLQVLIAP